MKKAIVTITIGDYYEKISKLTHPTIRAYAQKVGAEFVVINSIGEHSHPGYAKLDIYDLLKKFDRIIYADSDIIIRDDCPDLFQLIPVDTFAAFNEFNQADRIELMLSYANDQDWIKNKKYFNTGLFVCSKEHQNVFAKPEIEIMNAYEQTHLNYRLFKLKIKTHNLSHKFNRMTLMDWTGESRFDSFIMHYAGCPFDANTLCEQIGCDLDIWKNRPSHYPRNIEFIVSGGLGDQVCAEPTIRFLKETMYINDRVVVRSHYPRLFQHLDVESVGQQDPIEVNDQRFFTMRLPPDSPNFALVNHILTHPVDCVSIAAFRGQLPPKSKQPKLVGDPISEELSFKLNKSVLIHAGTSWPTKTFPKEFWLKIIDGLLDKNISIVLIGKKVDDVFSYVDLGEITDSRIIDLRDRLSLGELITVIEEAKGGLISNDSSPIHIAGAFDNPITLITIAKEAYRILPIRKGSIEYKTKSFGSSLNFRFDPNCPDEVTVDKASDESIEKSLPKPEDVVEGAYQMILETIKGEAIK